MDAGGLKRVLELDGLPVWQLVLPGADALDTDRWVEEHRSDDPPPEEEEWADVALHRRWHERHGAVLLGLRGDLLELHCARPPVERLAAGLQGGTAWCFWWD